MTLHYITLHCITLHYITLYCITLNYITLYDITWSKILYYLRLPQPKNQIHNAIQGWWVDGLMGWWVNEFMDSWVDGYWFLVLVPEYWFPSIGSRVPYPVTQNACTIHSSSPETMPKWRDPGLAQKVHRMHPNDGFPRMLWTWYITLHYITSHCINVNCNYNTWHCN